MKIKGIFIALLAFAFAVTALAQEVVLTRDSSLRAKASSSSELIESLPAGTVVTVVSKRPYAGYVKVETKDDKTGWVLKSNLGEPQAKKEEPASPSPTPVKETSGAKAGDQQIYPRSDLTPGKANSSITQENIVDNICNKNWSTSSVRPPVSVTSKIKKETMKAYGFTDVATHYELDHLMSLQVGGCPDCVENLWPEAYGDKAHPMTQNERAAWNKANPGSTEVLPGALEKDLVENHVHDEICFGIPNAKMSMYAKKYPPKIKVTLARGQEILATDWYACYVNMLNGNKACE